VLIRGTLNLEHSRAACAKRAHCAYCILLILLVLFRARNPVTACNYSTTSSLRYLLSPFGSPCAPLIRDLYSTGPERENMSDTSVGSIVKGSTRWSIALSVLMIIAGVLAIAIPAVAGVAIALIVAWLLILSGVAHWAFAWHTRGAGAFVWELILGAVYVLIGGYVLMHPVAGLASLTLALAAYLFVEAILEWFLAFRLRPRPGSGWLMFDGIITLILAIMIASTWPSNTDWVLGTLVGISMLFSGVTRLMLSLAAHHGVAKAVRA
jgi:uncharacterized membrane protein HdeD (DUF308 family)